MSLGFPALKEAYQPPCTQILDLHPEAGMLVSSPQYNNPFLDNENW